MRGLQVSIVGPGSWRDEALRRIAKIHADMPKASAEELKRELRKHSSDFSCGTSWGRKVWPSACRQYLTAQFGVAATVLQKKVEDSPIFSASDHAFPFRSAAQ